MQRERTRDRPRGRGEDARNRALEAGARADATGRAAGRARHLPGRLPPDEGRSPHQVEAHHFCRQVNEDFAQCALFDGNTAKANLNGIEYIISERLFERCRRPRSGYWHPHNGEILSGQLVAPGLPDVAEHALMKAKMNSYGKTWHTWNTETHDAGDIQLPLGEPALAWSFNRVGEARQELIDGARPDDGHRQRDAARRRARTWSRWPTRRRAWTR